MRSLQNNNMNINEHILKISGSVPIDDKYELGQEIDIKLTGEIVQISDKNRQDGTMDRVYCFKVKLEDK